MFKVTLSILFWLCCSAGLQAGDKPGELVSYGDGGHYLGELVGGDREGEGVYLYPDYSLYICQWQAGRKHGQGLFKWPNGNVFEGQWRQGIMHGRGAFTFADGGIHEGVWDEGLPGDGVAGDMSEPGVDAGEARCRQVRRIQAALREISARLREHESVQDGAETADVRTWGIDESCR